MDYHFRSALLSNAQDYASHTPRVSGPAIDCSLGVNPYSFAPEIAEVLRAYDYSRIARYPHEDLLRPAIARYWRDYAALETEQIALCNGSFLGLFCLNNLFAGGGRQRVVSFVPTFTDMLTSAAFFGMEIVPVPFVGCEPYAHTEALLRAIDRKTALVYLDRPNNPTGSLLPRAEAEAVLDAARRAGAFVLVDEAFADYLPREGSCVPLLEQYDNLILARTFSKGFGLADLRAGYLLAPPRVVELYQKTVNPFILPTFVRRACTEALAHPQHPAAHAKDFAAAKQALRAATGHTLHMEPTDDRVPICAVRSETDCDLQDAFLRRGILTVSGREFSSLDARTVRISIPTAAEAKRLIEAAAALDC